MKNYTENRLYSNKTIYYMEKKLYKEKLFGKKNYIIERIYGEKLDKERLYRKETI